MRQVGRVLRATGPVVVTVRGGRPPRSCFFTEVAPEHPGRVRGKEPRGNHTPIQRRGGCGGGDGRSLPPRRPRLTSTCGPAGGDAPAHPILSRATLQSSSPAVHACPQAATSASRGHVCRDGSSAPPSRYLGEGRRGRWQRWPRRIWPSPGDAVEELVEHDTEVLGSNPGRVMQFACLVGRAEGS